MVYSNLISADSLMITFFSHEKYSSPAMDEFLSFTIHQEVLVCQEKYQ